MSPRSSLERGHICFISNCFYLFLFVSSGRVERGHICVIFNCFICFYLFHQGGWREEIFVLAGRGVQLAGIGTAPGIVTAEVFFIANIVLYS